MGKLTDGTDTLKQPVSASVSRATGLKDVIRPRKLADGLEALSSFDALWYWDLSTGFGWWSQRFHELLGFDNDELEATYSQFRELLHPEDKQRALTAVKAHLAGTERYDIEHRLRLKSGEFRWFHARGEAVWDDDGIARRMFGSIRDITDEKQATQASQESEQRLHVLLQSLDDVVWFSELDGTLLYINDAAERIYGRPTSEFYLNPGLWLEVVDPRDRRAVQQSVSDLMDSGTADIEYRIVRPDGQTVWIHDRKYAILSDRGLPARICGIASDVTARRSAEEVVRLTNRLYAEIHELQSHFIATASSKHVFDGLLQSLLRISESEYGFIGEVLHAESGEPYLKTHAITNIAWNESTRQFYENNAPNGMVFTNMKTLFGSVLTSGEVVVSNDPSTDERRGGLPEGHPALNAFLGIPLFSADKLVGMAGVANRTNGYDASLIDLLKPWTSVCGALLMAHRLERDRKQAVQDLQESESQLVHISRLSTMGEMLAGISHEINQPLAAISNFAEACRYTLENIEGDESERLRDWMESISQQAVRCGDIIRRLRRFAKKRETEHVNLQVNRVVQESVALVLADARFQSINILCELTEQSAYVFGSKILLQQVLVNLLRNACEAVAGCSRDERRVIIRTTVTNDVAEIAVEDNGPGIDEKVRDTLFEPFVSSRATGLGIGLAISRSIVEKHAGRIWVDSADPQGATFRVSLPLAQ